MKKMMRKECIARLKEQDKALKRQKDDELTKAFLTLPQYQKAQTIATFLSMEFEVDTSQLIQQALADGKRVLVPKVLSREEMAFLPYDAATLAKSTFGVLEPQTGEPVSKEEIDLIHVPGLVFNEAGFRIGYGGGFYDRYLADYKGDTVSTIYAFQQGDFQVEDYDVAVAEVICR